MRNLSEMIECYTLCPFDIERKVVVVDYCDDGFVGTFDARERGGAEPESLAGENMSQEDMPDAAQETIDIEAETRKVFEDAFVQGEKAGHEMGLKRVDPLVKRLNQYISEIEDLKGELFERTRKLSVELALAFAEAIVLRSCEDKKEVITDMVRKALDICEGKSDITIRVRPSDAPYISCGRNAFLKVVPDESLQEPGFVIETNFGDIDGKISTQLEELKKRILE
jgi:flagellar assembly protein FliH